MNVLANPVVNAALVALLLAWIGVVSAGAAYVLARIRKAEADINGVGAKADVAVKAVGAGPGALGAPAWLQGADLLPNGHRPAAWASECGEECVSMVVMALHGVPTIADALRVLLRGPSGDALTGAGDLVRLLALCNVRAVAREWPTGDLRGQVQATALRGRFVIALGTWVAADTLHWTVVHNASSNGWSVNDPWRGMVNDGWPWIEERYAGACVEITQARDGQPRA